jgi:hypothetical protein
MIRAGLALVLTSFAVAAVAAPPPVQVEVINADPIPVRDEDNPDRHPYSAELCLEGTATTVCDGLNESPTFTTPADKSVVIDLLSGECSATNDAHFRSLSASINGAEIHSLFPQYVGDPGSSHTIYTWHLQTRLRIPANATFRLSAFYLPNGSMAYCKFHLSGYTVNL